VSIEEGIQVATEFEVVHIVASAKTGGNIALMVETVTRNVIERNIAELSERTRWIDFINDLE
jgi:hypothetical protein